MIELVRRAASAGVTKIALITAGVVVLGSGTAVAAGLITSGDIKNQTIRSWDISEGGVAGSEIRQDAVHTGDIARDQVGSARLTPGVRDQLNAPNLPDYQADGFYRTVAPTAPGEHAVVTADCADGLYAIGGGFSPEDGFTSEGLDVIASRPSVAEGDFEVIEGDTEGSVLTTAWELWFVNESTETRNVRPWVVCADVK
ncbi:MAG: hypothetical protein ACRDPK_01480 [Carbonactinosporaceae bacterium]